MGDDARVRLVVSALLERARRAREDIVAFFDFVMEEETTREPVAAAPHQRVMLHFILDHRRCAIVLPPGFSKCHGKGTPILMADGSTQLVERIRRGDRVMGADGRGKVVRDTAAGQDEMFLVSPHKAAHPFVANAAHVLTLVNTDTGGVIDISVRDYLAKSRWFRERHKLFHVGVERFEREESLPISPYFLGLWFGDGNHSVEMGTSVKVTTIEPEVVEELSDVAANWGVDLVRCGEIAYQLSRRDPKEPNPVMDALRAVVGQGLSMAAIKRAPRDQRAEFLAGFIDADAGVVKNCATIVQKRPDWARDVAFIARSLGLAVSETTREVPGYGEYASLGIYGDWAASGVRPRVARKRMTTRTARRNALRSSFTVKPLGVGDYYGFTIGGDGRYLLGDFTVTHNTYGAVALTLWILGHDPTARGAIVSAAQSQSEKVVMAVRAYIENSPRLRLVFPELVKTVRDGEAWTQTAITVQRPPSIRDPSLAAYGLDSKGILGSRLKFAFVDDLLNDENTRTPEQREKVKRWFKNSVQSRMDKVGETWLALMNTAWHPGDVVQSSIAEGWAALKMTATGDIYVHDDAGEVEVARAAGVDYEPWDSPELRLADPHEPNPCRLTAHDPDPANETPLWPAVFGHEAIAKARRDNIPVIFNQLFMCECRDDATALCKQEFVDACLATGRRLGLSTFSSKHASSDPVFIGVDFAFEPGEEHDDNAIFAFSPRAIDGVNVILDIDVGQWDAPTTLDKVIAMHNRYKNANNSVVVIVENNGCFPPGTPVLTKDRGYIPIEDVRVGDLVWTHKARWRPVTGLLDFETKKVARTRASGGMDVCSTVNHWFWLREAGRNETGHHRPMGVSSWNSIGFVDRPAYAAMAVPRWEWSPARVTLPKLKRSPEREIAVDEDFAMVLGLWMAEGSKSTCAVDFTFGAHERHLAEFTIGVLRKHFPKNAVFSSKRDSVWRVTVSSTAFAKLLTPCGARATKCLPFEWMGWPIALRLAVVRGWLMGDGCLLTNNQRSKHASRIFVGSSISRNWVAWARATLFHAGFAPSIAKSKARTRQMGTRKIVGKESYVLRMTASDTRRLREQMTSEPEGAHWPLVQFNGSSRTPIVKSAGHAWGRIKRGGMDAWEKYVGPVHNLVVEEDESFTANDYVVHNGQAMFKQFALKKNASLPIKSHTTTAAKAKPWTGIPGIFVEMMNGAWAFPNDKHGQTHPNLRKLIDACLYYTPQRHTDDTLMAMYFARDLARRWGALGKRDPNGGGGAGAVAASVMRR